MHGDQTEVLLDLSDHCIQTAARRRYRQLVDTLVSSDRGDLAEAQAELLRAFLTSNDFASLRAEHPRLAGGTPGVMVRIAWQGATPVWRWQDS